MFQIHADKEFELKGSKVFGDERQVIWIDIETRKVDAPKGWGYRQRWEPFMVSVMGACDPGIFFLMTVSGSEREIVGFLQDYADYEVRYWATRDFDEMVLRGRFTNARRALSPQPGRWPNLDKVSFTWNNLRKRIGLERLPRAQADVGSKDVPLIWEQGSERDRQKVALHCSRDVVELVLRDPDIHLSASLRKSFLKIMGGMNDQLQ